MKFLSAILARESPHRFVYMLVALVLLYTAGAFISHLHHPKLASAMISGLVLILVVSAIFAASQNRKTEIIALCIALPTLLIDVLAILYPTDPILIAQHLLLILFLLFTSYVVLQALFSTHRVTFNSISASLCVYLLLGIIWALLYSLTEILEPGAFDHLPEDSMLFGAGHSRVPLYYSLVTLTTLGYGDITPTAPVARMLSAMEAFIGPVYLAVLVARLVGIQVAQSLMERSAEQQD